MRAVIVIAAAAMLAACAAKQEHVLRQSDSDLCFMANRLPAYREWALAEIERRSLNCEAYAESEGDRRAREAAAWRSFSESMNEVQRQQERRQQIPYPSGPSGPTSCMSTINGRSVRTVCN